MKVKSKFSLLIVFLFPFFILGQTPPPSSSNVALEFLGTNFVEIPDDPIFSLSPNTNTTFEGWFNMCTPGQIFNSQYCAGNQGGYHFGVTNSGVFNFVSVNASGNCGSPYVITSGTTSVLDNNWHHFILKVNVTNNQHTIRIYLDGVLEVTNTVQGLLNDSNTGFRIGIYRNANSAYFNNPVGRIDEFRIYNSDVPLNQLGLDNPASVAGSNVFLSFEGTSGSSSVIANSGNTAGNGISYTVPLGVNNTVPTSVNANYLSTNVNLIPLTIDAPTEICLGDTIFLDVNFSGLEHAWEVNDGTGWVALSNGNTSGVVTYTPTSTGIVEFQVTDNMFTCSETDLISVDVKNCCFAIDNPEYTQIISDVSYANSLTFNGKYYIGDGVTVTVDNGAVLDLTNVDLVFGECAGIDFINGATVRANNSVLRPCAIDGTWRGLSFDGTQPSDFDNQINESTFKNAEVALYFHDDADGVVSNNLFSNCNQGVRIENNKKYNHSISGNRFVTEEFYPVYVGCYSFTNQTSYGINASKVIFTNQISQNEFTNSLTTITAVGVEQKECGGMISNNTFTDMDNSVNLISPIYNTSINSNTIEKNTSGGRGIFVTQSESVIIEINDNTISNHISNSYAQQAIFIGRSKFVSISANEIYGFITAILTSNSDNLQITENIINSPARLGIRYTNNQQTNGVNFITCNQITMRNFSGTGISVRNLSSNSQITSNCIFDSRNSMNFRSTLNQNLPIIRNNYLYNYTNVGINVIGYSGNIGTNSDPGMNTFWSNDNSAVDIQSSSNITVADNFGVFNFSFPTVGITSNNPSHSTASCANQIYNMPSQGNLSPKYKCDNIGALINVLNGNVLNDNALTKLSESQNQFADASLIMGGYNGADLNLLIDVIAATNLTNDEINLLKYNFYYKINDYINAENSLNLIVSYSDDETDFIETRLIDLKSKQFGWINISAIDINTLELIVSKDSDNSNYARSMLNNLFNYRSYIVIDIEENEIIKNPNIVNVDINDEQLNIYPSPATDFVTVELINVNSTDQVDVYDMTGKLISNIKLTIVTGKISINVSTLSNGSYFVTVINNETGIVRKGKFIKI